MPGPEKLAKYTITFQQVRLMSGMAADAIGASDYVRVAFTTVMIAYWEVKQWVGIEKSAKAPHVDARHKKNYVPIWRSFSLASWASLVPGCSLITLFKYSLAFAVFFSFR